MRYRLHMVESERGWGQDYFHRDFDSRYEAECEFKDINAQLTETRAPDVYIKALSIEEIP